MTKLTDVQKIDIENRKKLILKLRDELKESTSEMREVLAKVDRIEKDLELEFKDYYEWLEEEELIANPNFNSEEFVELKMESWVNLPWCYKSEVLQLLESAVNQVMRRLDQISNELNERECDEPDCG